MEVDLATYIGETANHLQSRKHSSSVDIVYETLAGAIRGGHLLPGAKIREKELVDVFGLSRTPIRQAFQRLQQRGLLRADKKRGLIVREISEETVSEMYAVRKILEGGAARLAAENISRSQLQVLRECLRAMSDNERGSAERAVASRRLHYTIYAAANNQYLERLLSDLYDDWALVGQPFFEPATHRTRQSYEEHEAMVVAIEAGDADKAEQAARDHIQETELMMIRYLSGTDS